MQKITEILSQKITLHHNIIEDWFAKKFDKATALFYNSADLRHSEFKIAPVDTNCFPAGFGNLGKTSKQQAEIIADNFLNKNYPSAKKILLISESHTRNLHYLRNLLGLKDILSARREVVIGTLIPDLTDKLAIDLENGQIAELYPLIRNGNKIALSNDFTPDLILLNNDLTNGVPEILSNLDLPITPSLNMGWHQRTKSAHFKIYNQLAEELAQLIEIDPWLISSMHRSCHDVDFKNQKGLKCLANYVDELVSSLRAKYQEYDIKEEPYCYIKADNGTYGMAVWPVSSGQEVLAINKKERNKMSMLKGSVENRMVMIQEGIKTSDRIFDKVAEPMIYLIGGQVAGNLFRVNEARDEKISLNSAGMSFFDLNDLEEGQIKLGLDKNKIIAIYSLVSRLAALAAALESNQNI